MPYPNAQKPRSEITLAFFCDRRLQKATIEFEDCSVISAEILCALSAAIQALVKVGQLPPVAVDRE